jgi:hypothetical protein
MDGLDEYFTKLRYKYPPLGVPEPNSFKHSFSPDPPPPIQIHQPLQPQQIVPEQRAQTQQQQQQQHQQKQQQKNPQQTNQQQQQQQQQQRPPTQEPQLRTHSQQQAELLKVPQNSILGEFGSMRIKRDNVFTADDNQTSEVTYSIKAGRSSISNNGHPAN